MRAICADACFLIGLYDSHDQNHAEATQTFVRIFGERSNRLLIPWPVMYETISTRMARNKRAMSQMEGDWKRLQSLSQLELISENEFRQGLIDECFAELRSPSHHYRTLSATDRVVRRMLSDLNLRSHTFLTYNPGDFADVCRRFGRQIYPDPARA